MSAGVLAMALYCSKGQVAFAAAEPPDATVKRREWLADLLDVSPCFVSQLSSGARRPSLDLAWKIDQRLGIPMTWWAQLPVATNEDVRGAGAERKKRFGG